jgi:hypothetical protein
VLWSLHRHLNQLVYSFWLYFDISKFKPKKIYWPRKLQKEHTPIFQQNKTGNNCLTTSLRCRRRCLSSWTLVDQDGVYVGHNAGFMLSAGRLDPFLTNLLLNFAWEYDI